MINYSEALSLILKNVLRNRDLIDLSLDQAGFRVVARDYFSDQSIPAFANSAVDGFAVRPEQTVGASLSLPCRFSVLGSLAAGDVPPPLTEKSGAWEIMTGAPFPPGFDAAVKVEDVKVIRDTQGNALEIELTEPAQPGQFYRESGEDFRSGTLVVRQGTVLMPEHLLALSALGVSQVQVLRKPRVSVISTGKELVPVGAVLRPGQVRNSSASFLMAVFPMMGVEGSFYSSSSDDPSHFSQLLDQVLKDKPDVIITTGGVSMGKYDYVSSVLADLGAEIEFHKIAMRPGKPNLFARFNKGPVVFGLPGNPVSTVVGLRFLVSPFLREFMGTPQEKPIRGQLKSGIRKPETLRCFFKASLEMGEGSPLVDILQGQESFQIRPLLESNVWAVLPEAESEFSQGSWIDIFPLYALTHEWRESPTHPSQEHKVQRGCC